MLNLLVAFLCFVILWFLYQNKKFRVKAEQAVIALKEVSTILRYQRWEVLSVETRVNQKNAESACCVEAVSGQQRHWFCLVKHSPSGGSLHPDWEQMEKVPIGGHFTVDVSEEGKPLQDLVWGEPAFLRFFPE